MFPQYACPIREDLRASPWRFPQSGAAHASVIAVALRPSRPCNGSRPGLLPHIGRAAASATAKRLRAADGKPHCGQPMGELQAHAESRSLVGGDGAGSRDAGLA